MKSSCAICGLGLGHGSLGCQCGGPASSLSRALAVRLLAKWIRDGLPPFVSLRRLSQVVRSAGVPSSAAFVQRELF